MWIFELLYFFYFFLRLRLEVPLYSQEEYRDLISLRARKLAKRYDMKIYVKGKPQPGFLAANHTSYLDPIFVQAIKAGGAVSKIEVRDYLLFGPIASKVGMLWVKRENKKSRTGVIHQLNQWDAANHPLWIFPEGTTPEDLSSTSAAAAPITPGSVHPGIGTGRSCAPVAINKRDAET